MLHFHFSLMKRSETFQDTILHRKEDILKNCLNYEIPPSAVKENDIFTTFELIHRAMKVDLKDQTEGSKLKREMTLLAHSYSSDYKPTKTTLKKHRILKRLRNNKDIVITRPDKGEGVVILNKIDYDKMINDIVNDQTKFKHINKDPL